MSHKSSIKALLAGAFLLAGSVSFAQPTPAPASLTVGVYPTKQADKFCLAVEKPFNTFAFVQLLAPTGEELYAAQLPKQGASFRQLFDLTELKDGTYRLRIKQGGTVIIKSIQLRTNPPDLSQPTRSLTLGN